MQRPGVKNHHLPHNPFRKENNDVAVRPTILRTVFQISYVIAVGALLVMVCVLAYSQLPLAGHDQQPRLVGSSIGIPSMKTNTATTKIAHNSRNLRKSTPAAVHGAGGGGVRGLSRLTPVITNTREDRDIPAKSKNKNGDNNSNNNNSLDEDYEEERVTEEEELLELEKADPAGHSHILLDMTRKKVQEELEQEEPPDHAFGLDDRDEPTNSEKQSKSNSKISASKNAFDKDEVLVIPRKRNADISHKSNDKKPGKHSADANEEQRHSKRTRSQALEISAKKLTTSNDNKSGKSNEEVTVMEVRTENSDEKPIWKHHEHIAIAAEE